MTNHNRTNTYTQISRIKQLRTPSHTTHVRKKSLDGFLIDSLLLLQMKYEIKRTSEFKETKKKKRKTKMRKRKNGIRNKDKGEKNRRKGLLLKKNFLKRDSLLNYFMNTTCLR